MLTNIFQLCGKSSLTTHDGYEAEDCCRLLGIIIHKAIQFQGTPEETKNYVFDNLAEWGDSYVNQKSVKYLARSK